MMLVETHPAGGAFPSSSEPLPSNQPSSFPFSLDCSCFGCRLPVPIVVATLMWIRYRGGALSSCCFTSVCQRRRFSFTKSTVLLTCLPDGKEAKNKDASASSSSSSSSAKPKVKSSSSIAGIALCWQGVVQRQVRHTHLKLSSLL